MRSLFGWLALAAAAVALALLMGQNGATVTLFWPPYRVDMSFNLVLGSVLLLFVLVHVALRSLAALRALPGQARRWRAQQRERTLHAALVDAWVHQAAGRYVRAKGAARHAVDAVQDVATAAGQWTPMTQTRLALAHLLAAEATHALQDREARNQHLEQALAAAQAAQWSAVHEAIALRAVRWAIDDRQLQEAQRLLGQLPQGAGRRIVALRIRLKLAQLRQDHAQAFETARLLAKHKAFSPDAAATLLRRLRAALFEDCHDEEQLRAQWARLDRGEQREPALLTSALRRLAALGLLREHASPTTRALVQGWAHGLLQSYAQQSAAQRSDSVRALLPAVPLLDGGWLSQIEREHDADAADAGLGLLAAETYHHHQLWGKAERAFSQAAKQLAEPDLRAHAWVRLAQLAERKEPGAEAIALAWKQAALALSPLAAEEDAAR